VTLLPSGKRLDELAAETSIPFDQIMRLMYSLAVIGIVVPEDWMPADAPKAKPAARAASPVAPRAPVERAPAPKLGASPDLMPADIEKMTNRLMEAFLKHRAQDAFDLLGLGDSATALEVQDAYLSFCRDFAPWQFDVPGLKSLVEKAQDLFLAGGRAFGELCDVERRNQLISRRRNLASQTAEKRDVASRFAIQSELLDSELQYKKGKAFMLKNRWSEAVELLQFAFDCDPQNSTYRSELAYCKFMSRPDIYAADAREELKEALRIDSSSGIAAYYLGMVEMDTENFEQAKEPLEKALRLLKGDRRPIEALKELQQSAKRKKKKLSFLGG
jgi:tetratricopeptide (TPR) repeat protein